MPSVWIMPVYSWVKLEQVQVSIINDVSAVNEQWPQSSFNPFRRYRNASIVIWLHTFDSSFFFFFPCTCISCLQPEHADFFFFFKACSTQHLNSSLDGFSQKWLTEETAQWDVQLHHFVLDFFSGQVTWIDSVYMTHGEMDTNHMPRVQNWRLIIGVPHVLLNQNK